MHAWGDQAWLGWNSDPNDCFGFQIWVKSWISSMTATCMCICMPLREHTHTHMDIERGKHAWFFTTPGWRWCKAKRRHSWLQMRAFLSLSSPDRETHIRKASMHACITSWWSIEPFFILLVFSGEIERGKLKQEKSRKEGIEKALLAMYVAWKRSAAKQAVEYWHYYYACMHACMSAWHGSMHINWRSEASGKNTVPFHGRSIDRSRIISWRPWRCRRCCSRSGDGTHRRCSTWASGSSAPWGRWGASSTCTHVNVTISFNHHVCLSVHLCSLNTLALN